MNEVLGTTEKRDNFPDIESLVREHDPNKEYVTTEHIYTWYSTFRDAIGILSDQIMLKVIAAGLNEESIDTAAAVINDRLNKYAKAARNLKDFRAENRITQEQFEKFSQDLHNVSPDQIISDVNRSVLQN